tara:strand:+ start:119 stop:478 length:360 start_codon:yes stop_codon:yes gene_type:complete
MYDENNIFAKILRGKIPNKTIYEDAYVLAFHDINPQAPIHALVIPKGAYIDFDDFTNNASSTEIEAFMMAIGKVARKLELVEGGYRVIANIGVNANTEVPHLHVHILGGKNLGSIINQF